MPEHSPRGSFGVLAALAAITGRSVADTGTAFREVRKRHPGSSPATAAEVQVLIEHIKTRLGIAPALDTAQAAALADGLGALFEGGQVAITTGDLSAWDQMLRRCVEHVPTIERDPVVIPQLPPHQTQMWLTLLGLESLGHPWVLVGGQMTMLHCLENGVTRTRPTDDGDVVVGVWTRRDALDVTSRFLRDSGFDEVETSDGYGYRFKLGDRTMIDVLLPEGLDRQQSYPTTTSGRRGFSAEGNNQALARAQRVPVAVDGSSGWIRRPNLLGAIVLKANAYVIDNRDVERHAQDLVVLSEIALREPRATLSDVRPGDRKPVRRFLRGKTADHAYFRSSVDPAATFRFLSRLAEPPD